jgi:hypothetical protein
MPTLSASDYTQYLKLKAAAAAYEHGAVPRKIQNVDQAAPLVSILNANIFTSQASFVTNPSITEVVGNARVEKQQVVQTRSTAVAKSTVSWTSGSSGSVGTTTSSKFQIPGGLPAKNSVGTYTRLPQQAGWS